MGLCLSLFMVTYTIALLPAIMPRVVRDLDSSMGYIQASLVLLSLVRASFAPSCANLAQRFGRKRIFLLGLGLFSLGILGAALAPNMGAFVTYYALVAGLGGVPLLVAPRDLMFKLYTDQAEKLALAALAVFSSLGGIAGSVLGGLLASQYGWRWAFTPTFLMVAGILFLTQWVPEIVTRSAIPIDWVGGLFSFLGFGLTLLGISLGEEYGWWEPKQIFAIFNWVIPPVALSIVPPLVAAGMIFLGLFFYWQRQQAHLGKASLLRMGVLNRKPFLEGMLIAALHTLITTGLQFNLYQFIPAVLSISPFWTAIAVLPFPLMTLVTLMVYIKFSSRWAPQQCVRIGLGIFCVGVFLLYQSIQPGITVVSMLLPLMVLGIGSGLFLIPISLLAFGGLSIDHRPEASGVYTPVQNLGSALGRAVLGTLLVGIASVKIVDKAIAELSTTVTLEQRSRAILLLEKVLQTFSRDERSQFWSTLPPQVQPFLNDILIDSAFESVRTMMLVIFGLSLVCFGVGLLYTRSQPPLSQSTPNSEL